MVDCIIVGGGIIGMLTAREIAATGADVLLLERGSMGGESSWAGGGILSPLYPWRYDDAVNALASYSQRLYPAMAKELLAESEIDPEYNSCGLMVLDQNELVQAEKWAAKWHMNLEILDTGKLVQQVEPGLGAAVTNALWLPDIAQMRNPRLVKSLAGSLRKRHIKYLENCEVKRLVVSKNRVTGVVTGSGNYQANKIIIAGGAWSKNIIGIELPQPEIEPVKGQMILFRAKPGILSTMVLNQGRYLIPRRDGRILAGSTLEYTGFEKNTTESAMLSLRQSAIDMIPALQDFEVEHHWAGLRPGTEAGIPYICQHPAVEGLYLNSGHFRNGVILGAASAKLMADLIVGDTSEINIAPYRFDQGH